jgi:Protein of unknown function (DUF402)
VRPGDVIQVRSVYGGRVRWAFPHRLIEDDGERVVLFLAPGARGVQMGRDPDGRYLERWARGDDPRDHTWSSRNVLKLIRRGEAHSLEVLWTEDWVFEGWYVNLQAPLIQTRSGFDTTDWALDIVVDPNGEWHWKDEDDFAEAQALGVFSAEEAAAVRAEGERVIAAKPWPTGWEDWRP